MHELAEAKARGVFRYVEQLAVPVMIAERRQSAGPDDDEECEAGSLSGRLPQRGAALKHEMMVSAEHHRTIIVPADRHWRQRLLPEFTLLLMTAVATHLEGRAVLLWGG